MIINTQLKALIERTLAHQNALKESDELFVARFSRHLGSIRTWKYRLLKGETDGIKDQDAWEAKWIKTLIQVVNEIEGVSAPVNYFPELPFARAMSKRLLMLKGQRNDRRCLISLAPTGVGKSWWAMSECAARPEEHCYVPFNESHREKKYQICAAIASKLGAVDVGRSPADAINAVIRALNAQPRVVFLDESHECGIMLMKLIRTLIDTTPSKFVYLAYPTQYDRMLQSRTGAIDEAKQLLGRALKPVFDSYREGLPAADIVVYLKKAAGLSDESAKITADKIGPAVRRYGNYRFLDDALTDAQCMAQEDNLDISPEIIVQAVADLCPAPTTPLQKAVGKG